MKSWNNGPATSSKIRSWEAPGPKTLSTVYLLAFIWAVIPVSPVVLMEISLEPVISGTFTTTELFILISLSFLPLHRTATVMFSSSLGTVWHPTWELPFLLMLLELLSWPVFWFSAGIKQILSCCIFCAFIYFLLLFPLNCLLLYLYSTLLSGHTKSSTPAVEKRVTKEVFRWCYCCGLVCLFCLFRVPNTSSPHTKTKTFDQISDLQIRYNKSNSYLFN